MLNALITDWSEWLEKPATNENIKKGMRKVKIYFMVWSVVSLIVVIIGLGTISGASDIEGKLIGLFGAIIGLSSSFMMKTWMHIQLAKFKILWEMNNRFEGNIQHELRRSEAQDL